MNSNYAGVSWIIGYVLFFWCLSVTMLYRVLILINHAGICCCKLTLFVVSFWMGHGSFSFSKRDKHNFVFVDVCRVWLAKYRWNIILTAAVVTSIFPTSNDRTKCSLVGSWYLQAIFHGYADLNASEAGHNFIGTLKNQR